MVSHALIENGQSIAQHGAGTLVPWWSFTKTVLAAAALALVRDNRLSLDEPLAGRPFSLRQVLRHQAGLTDYGFLPAYHAAVASNEEPWPDEEMLARARADKLLCPPGEGWSYSNIGYLLVRRLIEAASGEGLDASLQRLVLRPLGIARARVAGSPADLIGVSMGGRANYDPRWVYHGLLVGSLEDAAVLLDRLMAGNLLPAALMRAMRDRHRLEPVAGRPWIDPGYGLGLMIGRIVGGTFVFGHTGADGRSVIAVYYSGAAARRTCAAFAQGDDEGLVEREVARALSAAA